MVADKKFGLSRDGSVIPILVLVDIFFRDVYTNDIM